MQNSDPHGKQFSICTEHSCFDYFSCLPFDSDCLIVKVAFITTQNDVDVGQFLIWRQCDVAMTSTWRQSYLRSDATNANQIHVKNFFFNPTNGRSFYSSLETQTEPSIFLNILILIFHAFFLWIFLQVNTYPHASSTTIETQSKPTLSNCAILLKIIKKKKKKKKKNLFKHLSESTGPMKVKFLIEPLWHGGKKVCSNSPGHTTKMAAMPIYGKNLKKDLRRNQNADDFETWYAARGPMLLNHENILF